MSTDTTIKMTQAQILAVLGKLYVELEISLAMIDDLRQKRDDAEGAYITERNLLKILRDRLGANMGHDLDRSEARRELDWCYQQVTRLWETANSKPEPVKP